MDFVENFVLFAAVKEFCKSIKNWQSQHGALFWLTVYNQRSGVCAWLDTLYRGHIFESS